MLEPRAATVALATTVVNLATSGGRAGAAPMILTELHRGLGKLIGTTGFDVLLTRALKLAQRTSPGLAVVVVESGGVLKGLSNDPAAAARDVSLVLSHVFELLHRFIGEDLTRRVAKDLWPDAVDAVESKEPMR